MQFFFYGTLLDSGIRRIVLGPRADRLEARPARLHGWRRVRVVGEEYPVIVPVAGAMVDGCVIGPLPASAVARLLRFEGAEYRRVDVAVVDEAGRRVEAWTFVGTSRIRATAIEWQLDEWQRKSRSVFLRGLDGRRGRSA